MTGRDTRGGTKPFLAQWEVGRNAVMISSICPWQRVWTEASVSPMRTSRIPSFQLSRILFQAESILHCAKATCSLTHQAKPLKNQLSLMLVLPADPLSRAGCLDDSAPSQEHLHIPQRGRLLCPLSAQLCVFSVVPGPWSQYLHGEGRKVALG